MTGRLKYFIIILLLLIIGQGKQEFEATIHIEKFNISPQTVFLSQFDASNSRTNTTLTYRIFGEKAPTLDYLRVGVLLGENYKKHQQATTCSEKESFYHKTFPMKFSQEMRGKVTIGDIALDQKSRFFFLFVYQCNYIDYVDNFGVLVVRVENEKTRISIQQCWNFWPYASILVLCLTFIALGMRKFLDQFRTQPQIQNILMGLGLTLFTISVLFRMLSLVTKIYAAEKSNIFESLYLTNIQVLHVTTLFVLISVACGWYLNYSNYKTPWACLFALLVISNIVVEIFSHQNKHNFSYPHMYEGQLGSILLGMQMLNVIFFTTGCFIAKEDPKESILAFLKRLAESGVLFLMGSILSYGASLAFWDPYMQGESIPMMNDLIYFLGYAHLFYNFMEKEIQERVKLEQKRADEEEKMAENFEKQIIKKSIPPEFQPEPQVDGELMT